MLESAKNQTYNNIELIISDDCSSDYTVSICNEWIQENKERFVRTELLTVDRNTGIPANCNRGISKSRGEWVKIIAGDDALFPDAISNVCEFVNKNAEIEILLSYAELFNDSFSCDKSIGIQPSNIHIYPVQNNVTVTDQLEFLLTGGYHCTPALFIKTCVFRDLGYFNESYSFIEDGPFYLKAGLKNKIIYFAPIITVKYRKHINTVTSTSSRVLPAYFLQLYTANYLATIEYNKIRFIINSCWHYVMIKAIFAFNNKGLLARIINRIRIHLQPIRVYKLLDKINIK